MGNNENNKEHQEQWHGIRMWLKRSSNDKWASKGTKTNGKVLGWDQRTYIYIYIYRFVFKEWIENEGQHGLMGVLNLI